MLCAPPDLQLGILGILQWVPDGSSLGWYRPETATPMQEENRQAAADS